MKPPRRRPVLLAALACLLALLLGQPDPDARPHLRCASMAEAAFDLQYDGSALLTHEMDVRDLAPALLAAAELFQQMNRTLRPADPPVAVNVRATAQGSFLVQLVLIYKETREVLSGDDVTAAANLAQLLGVLSGLIALVAHRARSRLVREDASNRPGMIRITFEDGTTLEVPAGVLDVDRNLAVRRSLREVVRPLGRDGVDLLRIKQEDLVVAEVAKTDLPAFDIDEPALPPPEILVRNVREEYLTVLTVAFQEDRKWRFSDGASTFFASVVDESFLGRVDGGESFAKGDLLLAEVERVQSRDESGLRTEIHVLSVIDHISGTRQGVQGDLFDRRLPPVAEGEDDVPF